MKADIYFDKGCRLYVIRVVDAEENQVGDCDYRPRKRQAVIRGREMVAKAEAEYMEYEKADFAWVIDTTKNPEK